MKQRLPVIFAAALLCAAAPALAQFPGDIPDTFRLQLGGIYAFTNTQILVSTYPNDGSPGQSVNFENASNLPTSRAGFQGNGSWNFLGSSFLDFGYVELSRSKTSTITQDITINDVTYTAGATATSSFKSSFPYVDYRYGFIKNGNVQFGASLGAAWVTMKAGLSASAGVIDSQGQPIGGQTVSREAKQELVVPLLGVTFEGRLADGLSAGARVQGVGATIAPWSGSFIVAGAHIDWYLAQNFGIGAGYQYTRMKIKYTKVGTEMTSVKDFSYRYDGPTFYAILTF